MEVICFPLFEKNVLLHARIQVFVYHGTVTLLSSFRMRIKDNFLTFIGTLIRQFPPIHWSLGNDVGDATDILNLISSHDEFMILTFN